MGGSWRAIYIGVGTTALCQNNFAATILYLKFICPFDYILALALTFPFSLSHSLVVLPFHLHDLVWLDTEFKKENLKFAVLKI